MFIKKSFRYLDGFISLRTKNRNRILIILLKPGSKKAGDNVANNQAAIKASIRGASSHTNWQRGQGFNIRSLYAWQPHTELISSKNRRQ